MSIKRAIKNKLGKENVADITPNVINANFPRKDVASLEQATAIMNKFVDIMLAECKSHIKRDLENDPQFVLECCQDYAMAELKRTYTIGDIIMGFGFDKFQSSRKIYQTIEDELNENGKLKLI